MLTAKDYAMYYFAYGSNLSTKRLRQRIASARFISVVPLTAHQLRFHKRSSDLSAKCDIHETGNPGDQVHGVVFEIMDSDKRVLDGYEGLGHGYEEKQVLLTVSSGERIKAVTYYATHIDESLQPYHWYKHHVLTGALEHGFPEPYVLAIRNILSIDDPDPERHAREMAIYTSA
ncbi:MAG: gamma-glutamylcyclotransferase family protein [Candidatus Thiodiazotropha sp.]